MRKIGSFSSASGDYSSYIGAMENYVQTGRYYFINQSGEAVYAGRPPHYTLPYFLGRQIGSQSFAANLMSIFYVAIDTLAILCAALLISSLLTDYLLGFYLTLLLGLLSTYVSNWTFITVPDSGGAAFLMIGSYFYWKAYRQIGKLNWNILWTSFFFTWALMLRPYLIVVIGLFALIFILRKRFTLIRYMKLGLIACIPVCFLVLPWAFRNYMVIGKLVPFQENVYAGYGYIPSEIATRRLMTALGEDGGTFWDSKAMASWFSPKHYQTSQFTFPEYIKRDSFLYNSILTLRKDFFATYRKRNGEQEAELKDRSSRIRRYYTRKYAFRTFIVNPVRRMLMFWGHSGSYYISTDQGAKTVILPTKLFQSVLYFLVLFLGTAGLWIAGRKDETMRIFLIPLVTLNLMFPMILGFMEPRYAMSFYYPGLIGFIYLLEVLRQKFVLKRNPAISS